MQLSRLADARCAVGTSPARPHIFFVLATDKSFEVDSPDHISRLHEVERGEGYSHRCGPPIFRDSGLRSPNSVPTRIAVALTLFGTLLFCNQRITLST